MGQSWAESTMKRNVALSAGQMSILRRAWVCIEANRRDEAEVLLHRLTMDLSPVRNGLAVCRVLKGDFQGAIDLLRPLVFPRDGLMMSPDADPSWCANFALALLRSGNDAGFRSAVEQLAPPDHPAVRELRALVAASTPRRTGLRRLVSLFTGPPPVVLPPGFPAGWPETWLHDRHGDDDRIEEQRVPA